MCYSVAIRTLGKSGDKYRLLLESIKHSSVLPEKVVVVLPEGYDPPKERIGCEEFVFSKKGMIAQRMAALEHISSEYVLFADDDVSFGPDFVESLMEPLRSRKWDCSAGPLFSFFPATTAGKVAGALTATVAPSVFHKDMYVKLLRSGGWSYHKCDTSKKTFVPTESFAWTLFMVRTSAARAVRMEDESWIGHCGYEYGDDRVFAAKLIRAGFRACIVSDVIYTHNDAATGVSDEYLRKLCTSYFHYVFWHKYVKPEGSFAERVWSRICFTYSSAALFFYSAVKAVKNPYYLTGFINGRRAGRDYVRKKKAGIY